MKKLLGLFALIFCVSFVSCDLFSLFNKTGDLTFSISVDDAVQAANYHAERADTDDLTGYYTFLVQIKSNEGYNDWQIKTVRFDGTENQPGGVSGDFNTSGQYLTDNKVEFTFDYVPINQTYKVMFDMFLKKDSENTSPHLVLSGHSDGIEVDPYEATTVPIEMKKFTQSPISLKLEYEDGGTNSFEKPSSIVSDPTQPDYPISLQLFKEYGKLWHRNGTTVYPLEDAYYEIDSESNFPDSSYRFSLPYTVRCGETSLNYSHDFTFDGNHHSIKDFLANYTFPVSTDSSDSTIKSDWKTRISKDGFTFEEKLPPFEYQSNDEVISGHFSGALKFNKKNYDGGSAFIYYTILDDFFGNFSSNSSIALVLTVKGNNPDPTSNQLYYKIDNEVNYVNNPTNLGTALFNGNHCINHAPGETRFVIPINKVNPSQYLLLFIDKNSSQDSIDYNFDIKFYVFPESMNAFVFDVADPNFNKQYRYQIDEDWTGSSLSNGDNCHAKLQGVVCYYNMSNNSFSLANTGLTGELYYNDPDNNYDFTPITHREEESPDTKKFFNTESFVYGEDEPSYNFVFKNLINLKPNMRVKFLCHIPYKGADTLVVARKENLSMQKE